MKNIHSKRPQQMTACAIEFTILSYFRAGEVPPLKWEDIHDNYILVHQEQIKTVSGEHMNVCHTKTRYNRKFPITEKIRGLLERIKEVHKNYYPDSPSIFPNTDGTDSVKKKAVYDCFHRICQKCGITLSADAKKGLHSFRRVGATNIMNATHDPVLESRLLGHSSKVAEKHYITGVDMEKAAKIIDSLSS